uniref:NALCN channel auxiliary factor 1 n=1 Tax=Jaculus jaculus TaxID=51337 RepID=A0A8C5K9R3_JACJA
MTRGAWMCRQYDDGLKICLAAPRENEKPFIDSERAQKWRLSLASLLFFTVLLSDHLWFCAEAKLTRTRDKEQHPQQQQQQQHQQQQQQQQHQQQQQRQQQRQRQQQQQRQQDPSWPALLASMGESSPAAQAHRLLSASPSPTLPPSPGGGGGGGGKGTRSKEKRSKPLFLGNSARPVWRLETCYPQGASSGQCFTVESADAVCARNWSRGAAARGEQQARGPYSTPLWNLSDFYLSFCNSYTLWELFSGLSSPSALNCSLDAVLAEGGEMSTCRQCVEAYQDYDHHAQEKYEEFESVLHKYLQSEEYSVKSCPEDCKIVYKAWLCSQYFEVTQFNCRKTIPCKQYCLEVQTRCPFILPDNDEVIYGGLSSFICTGEGEVYL